MKKFLTIMLVFIAAMGIGFAGTPAVPTLPNDAEVTFTYTLKTGDLTKTMVGFYPTAVGTYENMLTNPSQVGTLAYNTDFGGDVKTSIFATVGTNWAKEAADSKETAIPSIHVTLTLNPFKQDNAEKWLGYDVDYKVITRAGATKTINDEANTITVTGTELGQQTLTNDLGAFVHSGDGVDEQGFLEYEFTNMKIATDEGTTYKPTVVGSIKEDKYTATWTFSVTAN